MTLQLPPLPQPNTITVNYSAKAWDQIPTAGGKTNRLSKPGGKFQTVLSCQPLMYDQAIDIVSLLDEALTETIRVPVFQPMELGSPGTPVVDGSGQTGKTMTVSGFTPGYTVLKGQLFNIVSGGVYYLHRSRATVTADVVGAATLAFYPEIRVPPSGGDTVEFVNVQLEGYLDGSSSSYDVDRCQTVGMKISVTEAN